MEHEQPGLLEAPYRALTIGLIFVVTMVAFEAMAVATALPIAKQHLGHIALYGWLFSGFLLATLIGIAVLGRATEKLGMTGPMGIGLGLFAGGLAVGGAAPSMIVLVLGRVLQGVGAGAVNVIGFIAVSHAYPAELRPKMMAWLSSAWVLPSLAGPLAAGALAQDWTWRAVFLGVIPFVVLATVTTLPPLSRVDSRITALTRSENDASAPPAGAAGSDRSPVTASALLCSGVGLVIGGSTAHPAIAGAACAIVGLVLTVMGMRALVPGSLLEERPGIVPMLALKGLNFLGFIGVEAMLPLTLVSLRHQSPIFAGLSLTVSCVAWTAGSWAQTSTVTRFGYRATIAAGLACIAAGNAGVLSILSPSVPVWIAPASWFVAGLGIGLSYPAISLAGMDQAGGGHESTGISAMQGFEVVGGALAAGLGGAALAWSVASGNGQAPGIATTDIIGIAALAVALVVCRRVPGRLPAPVETGDPAGP